MAYNRIKNIDIKTCTHEQYTAYKIARYIIDNTDILYKYNISVSGICKSDLIYQSIQLATKIFKSTNNYNKYDIDLTICALRAGLENYILSGDYILTSYEKIGNIFTADYLN